MTTPLLSSLRGDLSPKQSKKTLILSIMQNLQKDSSDFIESNDSIVFFIDCHESQSDSRNDDFEAITLDSNTTNKKTIPRNLCPLKNLKRL